jgi:hypothetical protein
MTILQLLEGLVDSDLQKVSLFDQKVSYKLQWSDQANGIDNLGLEPKSSFQVDHSGKNSDNKDLILVYLYSHENKLG